MALVPYASSLKTLRDVLAAACARPALAEVRSSVDLAPRQLQYYAEAAEVLGFANRRDDKLLVSRLAHKLLSTRAGSPEEAAIFRRAIESSAVIEVVPELLSLAGTKGGVVAWLRAKGETRSMAEQRGKALERWREHVLRGERSQRNLELPLERAHGAGYLGRAMLRRLEIRSFKAFADGKRTTPAVETAEITLLVGPNGAGKSTILQALDILGSLVRGNITQLLDAQGWEYRDLPHLLSPKQRITFAVDVALGERMLRWTLTLGTRRRPGIEAEKVEHIDGDRSTTLLDRNGRKIHVLRELSGEPVYPPPMTLTSSWLSTLDSKDDRDSFPGLVALKEWAERIFPFWSLDPNLLRAPSRGDATIIGPHGGDLASFLHHLKRRDRPRFDAFVKRVQQYYPRLVAVEPKATQYGWKKLEITERWNREQASFNAKQVSDGLLRLLAVASIPDWKNVPTLVLLDEVENGMHPRLIAGVTALLQEISKTTQVIATTHSPITVNYVDASCTRIVTRDKSGAVRITALEDTKGYASLREHFEPGELWYNVGEERLVQ